MSKRRKRNSNRRHAVSVQVTSSSEEDDEMVLLLLKDCVRCLIDHLGQTNRTIENVSHLHLKLSRRDPPLMNHDHNK